jgi:hypothetical protein
LGLLTALAFSSTPYRESYLANYTLTLSNESSILRNESHQISITYEQKNAPSYDLTNIMHEQISIPDDVKITNTNLTYISTHEICFADTSIISETIREILRHISNKFFFISIGIVTILYTITFILALQRQNPRIRALKRSLNVLNKFDSYPSNRHPINPHQQQRQGNDCTASSHSPLYSSVKTKPSLIESKHLSTNDNQQYEMTNFISTDELDDQQFLNKPKREFHISISEATSIDLPSSTEKFSNMKQVSFQVANSDEILINNDKQHLSSLSNSFETGLDQNNETYYKFPCPCSTTRQLLIKFHFAQPTLDINQWLCCCCCRKKPLPLSTDQHLSVVNPTEDETSKILSPTPAQQHTSTTNSETLRRQLHRHRIQQIRMASTFLLITVSFVLFYLPSILNAERYIKSPSWIYYLYLWTHALNPIIYCFMNVSLRTYVLSMFKCQTKQRKRNMTCGATTVFER